MELLLDPHVWLAFATLAALEIVLGIDNIIFISILVGRLPKPQQARAFHRPVARHGDAHPAVAVIGVDHEDDRAIVCDSRE